jgi:hypothetical protein
MSLSVDKAQAASRLYVTPYYRGHYYTNEGLPWYAVRAYYFGGRGPTATAAGPTMRPATASVASPARW